MREENGIGISTKRVELYKHIIKELVEYTSKHFPNELTIDDARTYVNKLQASDKAIRTKQQRMSMVTNLFSIGVRFGLVKANPFSEMRIKTPKNLHIEGYRPFTKEELKKIIGLMDANDQTEKVIIAKTLLCTGARCSDISQLRQKDLKQTKQGIWFIDLVDEPVDKFPHPMKGGYSDERQTPLHPWLIKQGILNYSKPDAEGYLFGEQSSNAISGWFRRLLQSAGMYEQKKTVIHSFRGTLIDLMREARLPQDVRRAITGHSSKDIQDRVYGEGLQKMPDVLYKEVNKIDLNWLTK